MTRAALGLAHLPFRSQFHEHRSIGVDVDWAHLRWWGSFGVLSAVQLAGPLQRLRHHSLTLVPHRLILFGRRHGQEEIREQFQHSHLLFGFLQIQENLVFSPP